MFNSVSLAATFLTIYTNHPSENFVHEHKTIEFDLVGGRPATIYPNQLHRLERVEKIHHRKTQFFFVKPPQTARPEPFDFPTGITGFPRFESLPVLRSFLFSTFWFPAHVFYFPSTFLHIPLHMTRFPFPGRGAAIKE